MKETKQYIIPVNGLSDGSHAYTFLVEDDFFQLLQDTDISGGNVDVLIDLQKSGKVMKLNMDLKGNVIVPCDRCLDDLLLNIDLSEQLIVEYGIGEEAESDDNIIVIPENKDTIDLKQHILEYILLGLPYQRIHADDEDGFSGCNPEMLDKLEELASAEIADDQIDPRWNELKKIKNGTS